MSCSEYEYETDSGCLSVKVRMKEEPEEERPMAILPYVGLGDLRKWRHLVRSVVAEFAGTLALVLIGCGSCAGGDQGEAAIDDQANTVRISLCFGLVLASLAQALGHVSGAHLNPAVTLGLWLGRQVGLLRGLLYVGGQCGGAVAGAAILRVLLPDEVRGSGGLGMTLPSPLVGLGQAVAVEAIITGILVLVVFAVAGDPRNSPSVKGSAPLAIGLTVAACHLFAVPLTGSSMNPARSLGPAAVLGNFSNHWVYWVGPLLGGSVAALFYQVVLRTPRPKKTKTVHSSPKTRCLSSPPYEKPAAKAKNYESAWASPPASQQPTSNGAGPRSRPTSQTCPPTPNTNYNVLATQENPGSGRELVWVESPGPVAK